LCSCRVNIRLEILSVESLHVFKCCVVELTKYFAFQTPSYSNMLPLSSGTQICFVWLEVLTPFCSRLYFDQVNPRTISRIQYTISYCLCHPGQLMQYEIICKMRSVIERPIEQHCPHFCHIRLLGELAHQFFRPLALVWHDEVLQLILRLVVPVRIQSD